MNDLTNFAQYLTEEELATVAPMLERLSTLEDRDDRSSNYMSFVKHVWPQFIEGRHHKIYAEKLQAVADGKLKRLILTCRLDIRSLNLPVICFQRGLWGADLT